MSDQGPGGYGGGGYGGGMPPGGQPPGGQGGWGQPPGAPPGAPPGGYGAPPGGYGPPPGGYGQPPGAPQAWPPQQPVGFPPPGAPAPKAKPNPLMWVGIGCGALLLLGGAGVAWAYFSIVRPAQELAKAAAAASSLGATISVGDGGVSVRLPGLDVTAPTATAGGTTVTPESENAPRAGTPASPSGAASAAPAPTTVNLTPGGPSCAAAAACCKAMLEKSGASAQVGQCEQLKNAPEFGCAQALATYRKTAPLVGAACP